MGNGPRCDLSLENTQVFSGYKIKLIKGDIFPVWIGETELWSLLCVVSPVKNFVEASLK